jgi:hypothetical protein
MNRADLLDEAHQYRACGHEIPLFDEKSDCNDIERHVNRIRKHMDATYFMNTMFRHCEITSILFDAYFYYVETLKTSILQLYLENPVNVRDQIATMFRWEMTRSDATQIFLKNEYAILDDLLTHIRFFHGKITQVDECIKTNLGDISSLSNIVNDYLTNDLVPTLLKTLVDKLSRCILTLIIHERNVEKLKEFID